MRFSIVMMIAAIGLWACAPSGAPPPEPEAVTSPTSELSVGGHDVSDLWRDGGAYNLAEMIVENVPDNYAILGETLTPEFFVAYDAQTIRKQGARSMIDTLIVRYRPFLNPPLTGAKSVAMKQQFICNRGRYRVLSFIAFSGWGLTGEEIAIDEGALSDHWFFVRPETVDSAIMVAACG